MHRPPEEITNYHVLMYPSNLAGSFKQITEHQFKCFPPSADLPANTVEEPDEAP
jgi:hypothetical protein